MGECGHRRSPRHFAEGALGTIESAAAIRRDSNIVVHRRAIHSQCESLLVQRERGGEILRLEGDASLTESRFRFRCCGLRCVEK